MGAEILALSVIILLFSVILHEVMHGYVAKMFGDHTAEHMGRLTLNPIPHIDPIGTILVPALLLLPSLFGASPGFFIAWAKPVPVNPLNFKDIKRGELYVSLAGVGANFALAITGAVLYHIFQDNVFLAVLLGKLVSVNVILGVFNLLPIPPLDGSNALMSVLPLNLAKRYMNLYRYGFLIILALLYFNILGIILGLTVFPIMSLLGVPFFKIF
jgi:Zn-dependent protease